MQKYKNIIRYTTWASGCFSKHLMLSIFLKKTVSRLCAQTFAVYLFPFLCGLFVIIPRSYKRKNGARRMFIVTLVLRQDGHGPVPGAFFSLQNVLRYLPPVFRQTHSYTPNQSPLIDEIAFKGMIQRKVSNCSFNGRILKSSHGWCCVSINVTERVEQLSYHQNSKTCRKYNYTFVNCEPFSLSPPVWSCLLFSGCFRG